MKNSKETGITLIALVITIIVMLILVGVTINVALNGGLFDTAKQAVKDTQYHTDRESLLSAVFGAMNDNAEVKFDYLDNHLPEGFKKAEEDGGYTSKSGNTFYVDKNGNITDEKVPAGEGEQGDQPQLEETIPTEKNCEGYYADLDGNGNPDGIIYADLAIGSGGEKTWGDSWGKYKYGEGTEGLKDYVIEKEEVTSEKFGSYKAPMVKLAEGSGGTKDRFYVMALEDVAGGLHTWYKSAYGKLDPAHTISSGDNDFGKGKENTKYFYNKETQEKYGALDANDMWKVIEDEVSKEGSTWFVPSKSEWAAFADMCKNNSNIQLTTSNYHSKFGLSNYYWSSSQNDTICAYTATFDRGYIFGNNVNSNSYVRLGATF